MLLPLKAALDKVYNKNYCLATWLLLEIAYTQRHVQHKAREPFPFLRERKIALYLTCFIFYPLKDGFGQFHRFLMNL